MKKKSDPFLRGDRQWSIGIYSGASPVQLSPHPRVRNPVLTYRSVKDVKARFVADPFMLHVEDSWHMFFEVFLAQSEKGAIGWAESQDALRWQYRQIVLQEPFHLSYPYVFQWKEKIYMIPESEADESVRLYQADAFPVRWRFVKQLLTGKGFHDASLFYFKDRWWMFAGIGPGRHDTLCLYSAQDLLDPWQEHPKSPLIRGNPVTARPGGRVLVQGESVIRFAQEDEPDYGRRLRAFRITRLTTEEYHEEEISENPLGRTAHFLAKTKMIGWNAAGMHHVDPHPVGENQWVACVDGQKKVPTIRWGNRRFWIQF